MRKANAVATTIIIILLLILIGGITGVIYSNVFLNEQEDIEEEPEEILSKTFSIELLDNDTHTYKFQMHGDIDLEKPDTTYFIDLDDGKLPNKVRYMNFTYSYDEIDNKYPFLIEKYDSGTEKIVFQTRLEIKRGEENLHPIPVSTHERIVFDFNDQPVLLSAAGSFDFDGEILGYYWDYGDGRHSDTSIGIDGYSPSVLKAWFYEEPGTYTVSLYVMDNNFTRCEKPWDIEVIIFK